MHTAGPVSVRFVNRCHRRSHFAGIGFGTSDTVGPFGAPPGDESQSPGSGLKSVPKNAGPVPVSRQRTNPMLVVSVGLIVELCSVKAI